MGKKRQAQKSNMDDKEVNACLETMEEERTRPRTDPSNSSGLPTKKIKPKVANVLVRRSTRLKNSSAPNGTQKAELVVENVNLVESESELNHQLASVSPVPCEENLDKEAPQAQQYNTVPVARERNLGEKADYIIEAIDEFKAKSYKQGTRRQTKSPSNDLSYRSLYLDSQKKIEALMEEHYEVVKKLEYAHGQIDVYERMSNAFGAASLSHTLCQRGICAAHDENASPKQKNECVVSPKEKKKYYKRKKDSS